MTFFAFGVNHLRAPVEVREAFALSEEGKRALHRRVALATGSELILLSTCNRTEAYLHGSSDDIDAVKEELCAAAGRPWPEAQAFHVQDEDAVRHVLEVAAGLKSLVLGDAQIFSQLKEAYRIAVEEERVGTTMHRLMHTAFRTAKRIINETDLSTGAASVPFVAVDTARRTLASESDPSTASLRALVVGCGTMGRMALEALKEYGFSSISLTNRSEGRGREVAKRASVDFINWDERHGSALQHDVVVVATSAEDPVILAAEVAVLPKRATTFVDISVPRNIEAAVADLGYTVIDLDNLMGLVSETESMRRTTVPAAHRVVREMLGEFVSWVFHHQALQPVIQTIADTFETIRANEVERHHQRLAAVDRMELDRITQSIVQKILAVPVVRLKSVEPESINFVQGIRLLHALFRRGECEEQDGAETIPSTPTIFAPTDTEQREVCPIDPQLPRGKQAQRITELELDDVLRLFSLESGDLNRRSAPGDERRPS